MIYIVATPIGNLSDITLRAINTLKECDYILCEDTRLSRTLLSHHNIDKPLVSYHKFSETSQQEKILADLREGKKIGLISDAGTPGISDPGEQLVAACRDHGIPVTPIPGPCAAITALCASGLPTDKFQFIGFLSKKRSEIHETLIDALQYKGTTIFYESPHRLLDTLKMIQEISPNCTVAIARELTKLFEEHIKGTPEKLIRHWDNKAVKGEIVMMIHGGNTVSVENWDMSAEDHVRKMQEESGLSLKDAVNAVAELRGLNKRSLYRTFHKTS
jgi:16S rRNA (cytidine1402-2'-O)-methyltransferase